MRHTLGDDEVVKRICLRNDEILLYIEQVVNAHAPQLLELSADLLG